MVKSRRGPAASAEMTALKRARKALILVQREMESLTAAEQQHRLFFEKTPYPRLICDRKTLRFLAVNEAALALYGHSSDEFARLTLAALCPADEFRDFLRYCRRARLDRAVLANGLEGVFHHRRKDGTVLDVEVGVALIPFGGRECYLILAQDVRQRRRSEQRLHVQYATTQALAESSTVVEAMPKVFQAICETLGCDWGELWRVDPDANALCCTQTWPAARGEWAALAKRTRLSMVTRSEGLAGWAWRKNRPVWVTDLQGDHRVRRRELAARYGLRSAFAFPIRLADEVLGVILVFSRQVRAPDKPLLEMLEGICSQVGQLMGRRRVERQLLEISEREQQRIGRDLHDGLCQQLAGVAYIADNLRAKLADKSLPEADEAARVAALLGEAIDQARQLAHGLNPVRLEAEGLMTALQELAATIAALFSISCRFSCRRPVPVHQHETAGHVYRIAQEAIHNAITHGKARRIVLSLKSTGDLATLTVQDDGRGIPRRMPKSAGMGLEIMNHRVRSIGGQLSVRRRRGGGTSLCCTFPVKSGN